MLSKAPFFIPMIEFRDKSRTSRMGKSVKVCWPSSRSALPEMLISFKNWLEKTPAGISVTRLSLKSRLIKFSRPKNDSWLRSKSWFWRSTRTLALESFRKAPSILFKLFRSRFKYFSTGKSTSEISEMMLKPRSRYSRLVSVPENVSRLTEMIWLPNKFRIFRLDISLNRNISMN